MCAQIGFQGQRTSMLNYLPSWGQRECQRRRFRVINSVLERVGKETIKFSRNADEYSWGVFLCERSFITCNISHPNMMSLLKNERPWLEEGLFPFLFPFCVILKKKHTHTEFYLRDIYLRKPDLQISLQGQALLNWQHLCWQRIVIRLC